MPTKTLSGQAVAIPNKLIHVEWLRKSTPFKLFLSGRHHIQVQEIQFIKSVPYILTAVSAVFFAMLNAQSAWGDDFVITDVSVVPMDAERLLANQTVVVKDNVVVIVGDAGSVDIPSDMRRIDGQDMFLMPGIADLHVHLRHEDELVNYVAWGVTTVMHLGGSGQSGSRQLEFRRDIEAGVRLGPNIYATDRILDGVPAIATGAHSVETQQQARLIVQQLKDDGYDFIKIYNNVSKPVFDAIVDAGREQGLPVIGHISRNFDPMAALRDGQDAIAHTEELFFTYFDGPRSLDEMPDEYRPDFDKLPALIEVLTANSVAVMPDLSFTFGNLLMWDGLEHVWNDPEFAYLRPATASMWRGGNINRREQIEKFIVRGQWKYELLQRLTREFQRAGVLQVIGTDASLPGLFPGKAAHRELTELVKAGLSNYEVLAVATRNAGEFARRYIDPDVRFGQVRPGYRADLLLLEANPLDDIRNVRAIKGVAVGGRYVTAETLDKTRQGLREHYGSLQQLINDVDSAMETVQPMEEISALIQACDGSRDALETIESRINAAGYSAGFAGDLDQAVDLLEMNTKLFPLSPNTWDSLAEVTLYRGDSERALELYNHVLSLDPSFPGAEDKVRELTGL